jgi:ComF family protein
VAQFFRLDWPIPDVIVPVPISLTRWLDRGYNQSALIAKEMSTLLEVPALDVLKRRSGDYSQAGLSYAQRKTLSSNSFLLKKSLSIQEKTVLLIDDVYTTGTTLACSAEALCAGFPEHIYGLTLCKTPELS